MSAQLADAPPVEDIYRDPMTEHWLDGWGVAYGLDQVDMSQVDHVKSRDFQNRSGATVSQDQVDVLATFMADPGFAVPPLVVAQIRPGVLAIIDGNHRAQAAVKVGRRSMLAYVITGTDRNTLLLIASAANARNAQHLTAAQRDDRIRQMVGAGMAQKVVAAQWGIDQKRVSDVVRGSIGRDLAASIGINPDDIPLSKGVQLARLDREHVVVMGAEFVKAATAPEVGSIAAQVLDTPPSEQVATAHRLASELLARKATATTPKARRKAAAAGLSPAQISNLAAKLAAALTETPSLKSDPKSTPGLDALRAVLAK